MAAGWTITKAIETIVDEQLVAEWKEACEERESLPTPSGAANAQSGDDFGTPYIDGSEAIHRQRLAGTEGYLAHTRRAVFDELKEWMRSGRLVALGRAGSVTEPRKQVEESQWAALTEFDEASSSVSDANGNGFCGVIIYTILEAPGAAALIGPCTLASALEEYVLRDPEVYSRPGRVKGWTPANLRDAVGSMGDGRCLIHLTDDASAIEKDLTSFHNPFGKWWGNGTHAIRVNTLASRLAALSGLLLRGEMRATGVADGDKEERSAEISREDLRKPSTRLCLASGDIWQVVSARRSRRLFHAVRVEHAEDDANGIGQESQEAASVTLGRTPVKKKRGRGPVYDWDAVVPAAIAKAMGGKCGKVKSHMDLYKIIREEFGARSPSPPPEDPEKEDTIKRHMDTKYRWLLDAINQEL